MSEKSKDYYRALGVDPDASEAEIKKAFRRLARLHHPDVAKDKRIAEEKFKEINEAYEILTDPEKRQRYDQRRASQRRPSAPPGQASPIEPLHAVNPHRYGYPFDEIGFNAFLEQFFSGRLRQRGTSNPDATDDSGTIRLSPRRRRKPRK